MYNEAKHEDNDLKLSGYDDIAQPLPNRYFSTVCTIITLSLSLHCLLYFPLFNSPPYTVYILHSCILAKNEDINLKLSGYDCRTLSDYFGGLTSLGLTLPHHRATKGCAQSPIRAIYNNFFH